MVIARQNPFLLWKDHLGLARHFSWLRPEKVTCSARRPVEIAAILVGSSAVAGRGPAHPVGAIQSRGSIFRSGNIWPRPSSGAQEIRTALHGEGVVEKLSESGADVWARVGLSRLGLRDAYTGWTQLPWLKWREGRVEKQAHSPAGCDTQVTERAERLSRPGAIFTGTRAFRLKGDPHGFVAPCSPA